VRAIVQDTYGSADVLELRDIEQPVPRADEVLVRVLAASAAIGDWHVIRGLPYVIRVMGFGFRAPKGDVRGQDFAGRVEAVGSNVTDVRQGDEVFGMAEGAFAEYARAKPDKIAPKPSNLTFEEAATVPASGATALQGLRDAGKVKPGQKVLIIGAAGAVGTFAVQVAKALGAVVTGVCSTSKVELVRSIGADEVIDYTTHDFTETGERYDVILDTAGTSSFSHLRRATTPKGTIVIVGGEGGGKWFGLTSRLVAGPLQSMFVSQTIRAISSKVKHDDLVVLEDLIEAGKVTPVISETFALGNVADAIRRLEQGHARGKIVITI
jgi:NADPH:quinone reductase-like Zn-dependent oxidoreductase